MQCLHEVGWGITQRIGGGGRIDLRCAILSRSGETKTKTKTKPSEVGLPELTVFTECNYLEGSVPCALIYGRVPGTPLQLGERGGGQAGPRAPRERSRAAGARVLGLGTAAHRVASTALSGGHTCTSFASEHRHDPPADGAPSLSSSGL